MNYLRGAFSAASQYYKDLPPINPSTLTGAIDVIVIERPSDNGGIELACSPFHVRFGKWQVLRPGEKKVKVLVNGHSIPFDMKIGDAGEAFFVFETDEDVPDELVTSPILQATKVGESNDHVNTLGVRGGVGEDEFMAQGEEPQQEPDFLDLNAPNALNTPSGTHGDIPFQFPGAETNSATNPSSLPEIRPPDIIASESGSSDSDLLYDDLNVTGLQFGRLEKARHMRVAAADTFAQDVGVDADLLLEKAASLGHLAASSVQQTNEMIHPLDNGVNLPDDEVPPLIEEQAVQPPEVTYRHNVVLDGSGYHSKEASDQTITAPDQDNSRISRTFRQPHISVNVFSSNSSGSSTPESTEEISTLRMIRASSEPPEYGVSPSPPPEYSWEWGAFPQRSPQADAFPAEDSHMSRHINLPPPRPSEAPDESRGPSPPRSRSPIPDVVFANGGILEAGQEGPCRIYLNFEGQKFGFELSLCGESARGMEVEISRQFDMHRVSFSRLLEDSEILHNPDLVVRWDGEYIYQQDNSPLTVAIASWRQRTLSPPASPRLFGAHSEPRQPIASPRPSTSTWARWWSRNRTLSNVKNTSPDGQDSISEQAPSQPNRPSLDHSRSAPAERVSLVTQSSIGLQSNAPSPFASQVEAKKTKYAKTLRLTSDQLRALNLEKGANSITFSLSASGQIACTARIFLWNSTDQILVSDIDGTITKSDALGHVFTMIGRDWTHLGVAKLYTDICRNGYKIMYLTSRAIGQADSTRDYLKGINQNNYQLPEGPVIMSPDRLLTSLHREVIMRKPELFKMACLRDIQRLFGSSSRNPFYAGFGNRITDALSYRSVNIPSARIFTIDSTGEVKMELLQLAGYKSSYIHMTDLVDQMFPPINRKCAPEYTDFNYWRLPVAEYSLPETLTVPPSPTLSASARSDASHQSALTRLRNFSLGRRSSRSPAREVTLRPPNARGDGRIRTMLSFDQLNPDISGVSGVYVNGKGKERERGHHSLRAHSVEFEFEFEDSRSRRIRKRMSGDDMPGSLPSSMEDRIWGMRDPRWLEDHDLEEGPDDEDGNEIGEDEDDDHEDAEEVAAEEAFDDDLLATGEMEKVPFL